jgi:putative ABC transport system permease protein
MLVASPLLAAVLGRLLQPLARQLLGIEGRLAADNLARSAGRTGLVIGALAASVALLVQTAGTTLSTENALLRWVDDRIAADLFVTSGSPITSGGQALPMDGKLGAEIANEPEVQGQIDKVLPVRLHQLNNFRSRIVFLIAFDAGQSYELIRRRSHVASLDLYPRLHDERGSVLVSDNFAALYGVQVGDAIAIDGQRGPLQVKVIGTVPDYTWNRGTIFMDWRWYQEEFKDPRVDLFHVYLKPGADANAVSQRITSRWGAAQEKGLVVLTRDEFRNGIRDLLRRLYNIAYAQQLLVGMVAMLGVVTALLISVLQRRRELGLLRAVGASRAQVLRSVLAEALLMGLIGSLIGLMLGIPLEWYVLKVMLLDEAGFIFPVDIPWLAAGVVVGLSVLVATLAGLGPALHAIGLRIPEAIAYE